jgi:hypothetical protein
MERKLSVFCAAGVACVMTAGCAHYPESREQRPVYSYENVEMGPADSGQDYRHQGSEPRDSDRRVR